MKLSRRAGACLSFFVTLIAVSLFPGCGGGGTATQPASPTLQSITVTAANSSVAAGLTDQLTATGTYSDGSTQNLTASVTWSSATAAAATISTSGLATAVATGSSVITATSGSVSGKTTLTVTAPILESLAVTAANSSVAAGLTDQLTATGTYSDGSTQNLTGSVTWSSGTLAAATIAASGLATAVATGSSVITATSGSVSGKTTLAVTAPILESLVVNAADSSVAAGLTDQLTATGTYSDGSTQNLTSSVTWSSATLATATISSSGLATAVATGSSVITATSGSVSGKTTLTVTAAILESLAVSAADSSVAAGLTDQLTATGTYSDGSTQNLSSTATWTSGAKSVATIASGGLASTLTQGSSLITAMSGGISGTYTLSVNPPALVSIAASAASSTVTAGSTDQITATGTYSDGSTNNVTTSATWTSSDTAAATMITTTAGLADAVAPGTAKITATIGSISGAASLTVQAATGAAGCQSAGSSTFPSCFTLASPTQFVSTGSSSSSSSSLRQRTPRALAVHPMEGGSTGSGFQSAYDFNQAQVAALLSGSDPNPSQTLQTLGSAMLSASLVDTGLTNGSKPCFSPQIYYFNDPDAASSSTNGNGAVGANGQMPAGDLGIWAPTDSSGTQACAASELNYLMGTDAAQTQFALALAAEIQNLAGTNFPTTSGGSDDVTTLMSALFPSSTGVTVTSTTVSYNGTSYVYSAQFTASDFQQTYTCDITLTHTPGSNGTYAGVAEFTLDNGTTLTASTTRYQRTSQTHIDISARDTFYPSGTTPELDANGEIDPNDPNYIDRFMRIGASFDPTSALTAGSYLYILQIQAPTQSGPGPALGLTDVFQIILPGDGTGSAFYGISQSNIAQSNVWQVAEASGSPLAAASAEGTIDEFYCYRGTMVPHLLAQYQAMQYSATEGQYEPSPTVASQIRYAPTASCQYTDAQWNGGNTSGFWYDRDLLYAGTAGGPASLAAVLQLLSVTTIPQDVVADPNDTTYPFSLFGDGQTWPQQLIGGVNNETGQGYTFPTLY